MLLSLVTATLLTMFSLAHAASEPAPPSSSAAPAVDAQWECKTLALGEDGQAAGELTEPLTVGARFLLACEGPSVELKRESLALELPKNAKYMLRLLETRELSQGRGEFVATTWTAGEIKLESPTLSDGGHRVALGKINLNVSSVIDQKKNPEGKPYPPWGPVFMALPLWVYLAVAAGLLLVIALIAFKIRRVIGRRRLLKLLEAQPIAGRPYHHFHKELRVLARGLPVDEEQWTDEKSAFFANQLNQAFRWYLARELVVATLDRRPREIGRDLKGLYPKLFALIRRDLMIALTEIEKAMHSRRISLTDAHQVMELTRLVADHISAAKEA